MRTIEKDRCRHTLWPVSHGPATRTNFPGSYTFTGRWIVISTRTSDLIVSDHDFGEFYLRRRAVPDFIYDAARLFHLVLVGYSANDPPMRYLLNAVAADGSRFGDIKERFTFIGMRASDPVAMEDWKGRGITPIPYDDADGHAALRHVLERWASLSAINGKHSVVDLRDPPDRENAEGRIDGCRPRSLRSSLSPRQPP